MKREIKILSIFLFILTFFFAFMLLNNNQNNVKALDTSKFMNCSSTDSSNIKCQSESYITDRDFTSQVDSNNLGTLTSKGKFTLKYQYGYSEILIYAEKCTDFYGEDKTYCRTFTPDSIIHFSGRKTSNSNETYSKTIDLSSYYSDGDVIRVSIIYELATSYSDSFFYPQFCNATANIKNCSKDRVNGDLYALLPNSRVEGYTSTKRSVTGFVDTANLSASQVKIEYDSKKLIYRGNVEAGEGNASKNLKFANIIVKIEENHDDTEIEKMVYGTIIPALLAVLGICAVVTSTVLGYKIVKSADDPGERQEKIKSLRNIIIGLAAAALVLLAAEPVQKFVEKLIYKQ